MTSNGGGKEIYEQSGLEKHITGLPLDIIKCVFERAWLESGSICGNMQLDTDGHWALSAKSKSMSAPLRPATEMCALSLP